MIVFFLPNLRPGGAERVMLNLLLTYHKEYPTAKLVLLLGEKSGPLLSEVPSTIPIYNLEAPNATKSILPLIKFLKEHQPKVLFSCLGSAVAASVAKLLTSSKTVFINRLGNTIGAEKLLIKNSIKRALYIATNRFTAKNSDHVIFQCEYMLKDFRIETGILPASYSYIFNPVLTDKIEQLANQQLDQTFTFIAVGRLNPQKDYLTLLQSCVILKKRGHDFKFGIIGQGPLQAFLQSQINEMNLEDTVFLLGFHSNPYPFMKNAQFLVTSSLYEGFSNVIIESLCLGTPVIATNCPGGNAEVIHHGKNGYLCKVKDPEDLANAMELGLTSTLALNSQAIAQESKRIFNMDAIFKQYSKVLNCE